VKVGTLGYKGFGYIYSGIEAPLVDNRGALVLVVGSESVGGLETEIAQLQSDLAGDGWTVLRQDVSTNDSPEYVRSLVLGHYRADPANVSTVFLLGHVPILQSGFLDYDGHGARPMPADAYYGYVYDNWPTAPGASPSYLPGDATLMVGRVDLANMPGSGAPVPWSNERELLRNYLRKNHRWRYKLFTAPRRALMGNRRGDESGAAVAASGYRAFEPLVGPGNTAEANVTDNAPAAERWISLLASQTYLWAYGCGAGRDTAVSFLGTNGVYSEVWSTDVVGQNAQAVFVMLFGSHFGNWDRPDNLLRSFLATPDSGLAAFMSGEPHWFMHHLGLGETIGYSARLSLNNSTLYQNQVNEGNRAVYIALMGDPTLRMEPVSPPGWLSASSTDQTVFLNWGTPSEPVVGYHVYRAKTMQGPFVRLTPALLTDSSYADTGVPAGTYFYMVRAVALTTNPSGSYFNPSQGVFASVTVTGPPAAITLQVLPGASGLSLAWNSEPGITYRIEASDSPGQKAWIDLSGPVVATGTTASWVDPAFGSVAARFYRVVRQ
jgi:hypothetical protein